ncbi:hypothetical protein OGAPHI_002619 [Ogataea philodendri]|uniref:Uncharacterized protein n=1 Tax=Ogataea philodendri TaxID=1378263 RepID=A0A9P8PCR4_9ASCO|nr:uncharacterized protein OGAPHI_002619 [Ogataea philodendri]KAH3668864.1 hypothetical protein OGAPHI_002619 [Ogataea philodendri]
MVTTLGYEARRAESLALVLEDNLAFDKKSNLVFSKNSTHCSKISRFCSSSSSSKLDSKYISSRFKVWKPGVLLKILTE